MQDPDIIDLGKVSLYQVLIQILRLINFLINFLHSFERQDHWYFDLLGNTTALILAVFLDIYPQQLK